MPTNPTPVALQGNRYAVILGNSAGTPREVEVHLAQALDFTWRKNTEPHYEMGNVDVVDAADDPLEPSVVLERLMVGDLAIENLIANQLVGATSASMGTISTISGLKVYGPVRNPSGTVIHERQMLGGVIAEIAYRFNAAGVLSEAFSIDGTTLTSITSGMHTWPSEGAATHRVIKGRDAILTLASDNGDNADIIYRVQTMDIRAAFPTQRVGEMGNRDLAGVVGNPPVITFDFEVLEADLEPDSVLTNATKDYNEPVALTGVVRVYNPSSSRAAWGSDFSGDTPLKSFKLENLKMNGGAMRTQVRGLGAKRFSMLVSQAATAGSAGLIVYSGNPA